MRTFLIRLALFLSPLIIFAYPFDVIISNGLKHSTFSDGEIETWFDIYEGNIGSENIICGSSRAWKHFDPLIMEEKTNKSFYNLGIDAHNFYLQNLRFRELLKYNPKPKNVIYSLDMATLEKRPDLYNKNQFLPFMLWNKDIEDEVLSYNGFEKIDFIIPAIRYIGQYQAIKSGIKYYILPDTRFRYKGYHGKDLDWNNDLKQAKNMMEEYKVDLDPASVCLLDQFLKDCKEKKISVILVYSPEYIEGQNFYANRKEVMDIYNNFSEKYNLPFIDYSEDSMSFQKKHFYNSMHMNTRGSRVFTSKLANDLIEYQHLK